MVVNPGNVGISFVVLSYAGVLGVTLIADPLIVADQDAIADSFEAVCRRLLTRAVDEPDTRPPQSRGPSTLTGPAAGWRSGEIRWCRCGSS